MGARGRGGGASRGWALGCLGAALAVLVLVLWSPWRPLIPEPADLEQARKLVRGANDLLDAIADGCSARSEAAKIPAMLARSTMLAGADATVAVHIGEAHVRYFRVEAGQGGSAGGRGDAVTQNGQLLAGAEELLREAAESPELGPELVEHWVAREMLGRIHLARGQVGEAEKRLLEAAGGIGGLAERRRDLFEGGPFRGLGELYWRMDRPAEAAEALKTAADLEGPRSPAQLEAAIAALFVGDPGTAAAYGLRAHATASGMLELVRARTLLHAVGKLRATWDERGSLPDTWPGIAEKTRLAVAKAAAASIRPGSRACGRVSDEESVREFVADRVDEVCEALVGRYVEGDLEVVAGVARSLLALPDGAMGTWRVRDRGPMLLLLALALSSQKRHEEAAGVLEALRAEARWRLAADVGLAHDSALRGSFERALALTSPALEDADLRLAEGEPLDPFELLTYRVACLTTARAHVRDGRAEEARALLLGSIEQCPDDDEARQMLSALRPPR
jgi:tetratricopeptide (TPR) repeat protein